MINSILDNIVKNVIDSGVKKSVDDSINFKLIQEIFSIIKKDIKKKEDLLNLSLNHKYLRNEEFKNKIIKLIPKLKKKYKSHNLTCLHSNSLEKQKFPTINMIRQILKCNKLRLEPYTVCKGYNKVTKNKEFERYYIIKELK